jgi:citronellol/citronellal dehydrogenase
VSLRGKTLFITGASRGIGLAIALRAARDGANIAVAAKTAEPHPKLPGTIHSAAAAIEGAGGRALPLVVDVRDEASVKAAVERCAQVFGGIDICVNNASAINLAATEQIELRRYDLINQINTRGTFVTSRACLPYLKRADNPHILTLSPPLDFRPKWFAGHLAYSLSKYGMSLCMLGLAEEYRAAGIGCNALWPRTTIATAAVEFALGGAQMLRRSRKPEIVADAAHVILCRPARECTGQFFVDDSVLYEAGVRDFVAYSVDPGAKLLGDLFIDATVPAPPGVTVEFLR